jgi:AraC-like DNA-binding protein
MSRKRQTAVLDYRGHAAAQITALTHDYQAGYTIPWHFHEWDQLVYASRGVMTVRTEQGAWVVPTHRAVWIPAGVPHSISISGLVAMRTLYMRPKLAKALARDCCVVNISPLFKELILQACALKVLQKKIPSHDHLIQVISDQLRTIQMVPLQLPNPTDSRAKRIAEVLLADPGDRRPLAQICKAAGASKRTIERLFRHDVGLTVGKWRQQLRLMQAMRLLADGAKVTHAALEAGYSTPSAFIAMFGRALGTTPSAYFRVTGGPDSFALKGDTRATKRSPIKRRARRTPAGRQRRK